MAALCLWLRTQPMPDSIALAICFIAAGTVVAIAAFWGLPE